MSTVLPPEPRLSSARQELLRLLAEEGSRPTGPRRRKAAAAPPMSFAQERMWVSERFTGQQAGGTYTGSLVLRGPIDLEAMREALREVFRRHEILRTTFPGDSEPTVAVHEDVVPELGMHDLTGLDPQLRDAALERILDTEAARKVDLAAWPLLRLGLVRLAAEHHVLVLSYHHIVADGWSTGVFYQELGTLYSAYSGGSSPTLPDLELQYGDFAAWQREQAGRPGVNESLEYFKRQLIPEPPPLELPADRARTAIRTYAAATHTFWIPGSSLKAVRRLAQQEQTTPFTTLLTAFFALMSRCSGQSDLAVGSPVANRPTREAEKLIGCFMHPLVLRADLADDPSFRSLLARVRVTCLEAYAHQDTPFELVMRAVRPQWDSIHMPLFQVLFNVQPASTGLLELPGVVTESPRLHLATAALDLSLDVYLREEDARGDVEYSAELFDRSTIEWLMRCYLSLLKGVAANPDLPLSQIPVSGRQEAPAASTAGMSAKRLELLRLLAGEAAVAEAPVPAGPPEPGTSITRMPCSFGQERVWFMDRLDPQNTIYNQTQVLRLHGPLDTGLLRRALNTLVRRHGILRTGIETENGRPVQVVHDDVELELPVIDVTGVSDVEREQELDAMVQEQNRRPFDLGRPPLSRMSILRVDRETHLLCLTVHHLIGDGWSMRIFRRELALVYSALAAGKEPELAPLPMQYVEFARRERDWYREAIVQGQLNYWRRRLTGEIPFLDLPTDLPRGAGLSYGRNQAAAFELGDELSDKIHELRRGEGATVFMVLLAAFLEMLRRYTGHEDIAIDTPVSGRNHREVEGLIGFFVNSLILRADLTGSPTFRDLVGRVRLMCLEAYSNQDLPYDKVVSGLQVAPERRGQPLTTVSFMLHETVAKDEDLGGGVRIVPGPYDISDEFELSMVIWQSDTGLSGDLQYDPRLFTPATARRMTGQFQVLLEKLLGEPDRPVTSLEVLPLPERQRLLEDLNSSRIEVPRDWSLAGCVEDRAERTPDSTALVVPGTPGSELADETLTYAMLNARANRIARFLQGSGVGPGSRVGLCLDRSADVVSCVLAVLKTGAAYVPIDPNQGPGRLRHMLQDCRAQLVLTSNGLPAGIDVPSEVIELNRVAGMIGAESQDNLEVHVGSGDPAYIIYTSGSTGRPKGVMVTHGNMAAVYRGWEDAYRLDSISSHLQMAGFSFDVFAGDLIRAFGSGAALVLCPRETLVTPPELAGLIRRHGIECGEFVPAAVRGLMDHLESSGERLDSLKLVIVGSDTWRMSEYNRLRRRLGEGVRLVNSYGVAEATIDSSFFEAESAEVRDLPGDAIVPIGRPFPNSALYVLDRYMCPVPQGAAGELYLAGPGLAGGYSDRPDLTAERFLPNPFTPDPGSRIYRTGDRVRHLPDGNLAFLGRVDNQIKLRGFRIEPGEIEAALNLHPRIRDAAVLLYRDLGDPQLVAYAVATGPEGAGDLQGEVRAHLRSLLPDYMVPSTIMFLDALPLNPNGKLDRRALPAPATPERMDGRFSAPQTEVEKQVAGIWADLLGVKTVGLFDNFFDLGGHSLLLFELQNRLHLAFGEDIPIVELFRLTTVQDLSRRYAGTGALPGDSLEGVRQRARRQQEAIQQRQALRGRRGPSRE